VILESDYGLVNFRGEEYHLKSSYHTQAPRDGSPVPRDSISKTKYQKLIDLANAKEHIKENVKVGIIWKHSNGKYKGILITAMSATKTILVITTYLFNSEFSSKIFPKADQRIILEAGIS